jgi:hypothetical protein
MPDRARSVVLVLILLALFLVALSRAQSATGGPHGQIGVAKTQKPEAAFELTELQKARLDAVRQKVWRWQDKMQEALSEFGAICAEAQKENKWPAVQCGLNDLAITPAPPPIEQPSAVSSQPSAKPAEEPKK